MTIDWRFAGRGGIIYQWSSFLSVSPMFYHFGPHSAQMFLGASQMRYQEERFLEPRFGFRKRSSVNGINRCWGVNMTEKSIVHFNREESVPEFKKTGGKVYFPLFWSSPSWWTFYSYSSNRKSLNLFIPFQCVSAEILLWNIRTKTNYLDIILLRRKRLLRLHSFPAV